MSKRQQQTSFLKTLVLHGDSEERAALFEKLSRAERNEHSSWCALWLVIVLSLLSICGLCYSSVLLPDFFRSPSHVIVKVFCMTGLASAVCSVAFMSCWLWYRGLLNRLQEEARRFVMELLEVQSMGRGGRFPVNTLATFSAQDNGATVSPAVPSTHQSYWDLFHFPTAS